jgi:iron complex transport system ATP-binding protein
MLNVTELSVFYGAQQVLHDVSIKVKRGEVVALIGPNGAGKSTLIRAVSGVVKPQSGKISVEDQELANLPTLQRARLIAVVPQAISLPPAYSVWETVRMGRTPYLNFLGQTSTNDDALTHLALERVDGLVLIERLIGELSGGEQQRVLLARALAQSTPILLLDEPTAHLDLQYQVHLLHYIKTLSQRDKLAVLIALHDLNLAARYADRVVLLVDGRIEAEGPPKEVLDSDRVTQAYQIPIQVVPHPFLDIPLVLPDRNHK